MSIQRDKYLNDLIVRMGNGAIKVITGIRRCGKTYLSRASVAAERPTWCSRSSASTCGNRVSLTTT